VYYETRIQMDAKDAAAFDRALFADPGRQTRAERARRIRRAHGGGLVEQVAVKGGR
jgi:hypothetical protein